MCWQCVFYGLKSVMESWRGLLEWILGVEPWNEILSVTENSILVMKLSRGERPPSQNV